MAATVDNLVQKLRDLGGSANNPDLKQALGLKDKEWELLKKSALKAGVVLPGRGFGGRLMLADAQLASGAPQQPASRQQPSETIYEALRGKSLVLMDKDGKPLGKPAVIGELAVTAGMVVAVVE